MKTPQYPYSRQQNQVSRSIPCARLLVLILSSLLLAFSLIAARAEGDPPLRVGLVRLKGASAVEIACSVDFTVTDPQKRQTILASTYLEPITVFARPEGMEIKKANGQSLKVSGTIHVAPNKNPGGFLTLSTPNRSFSQYRGALEVRRVSESALSLVNEIGLEDYLMGVLPPEMPDSFQPEALKAQAIAARTYAERYRGRHADSGYDICDTVHCQVYTGSGAEKRNATKAVMETAGLVARYDGKLIWAVYSSDCGGRTQSGDDPAIGKPVPYLKSTPDSDGPDKPDYCSGNKSHVWSKTFTPRELEELLNTKLKPPLEGLKSIAFCEYYESGRVKRVEIVDGKGTRRMTGFDFRHACGTSVIRSAKMIVCTTEDGNICFEGKGFGHGVGMCQWGANGLAKDPHKFTCEQILKHYYPGITIEKLR